MPFLYKGLGQPIQIPPVSEVDAGVVNILVSLGFEWKEAPDHGFTEITHVYIVVNGMVRCVGTVERVLCMSIKELAEKFERL